jgi:SAM-dependent methyltransferase
MTYVPSLYWENINYEMYQRLWKHGYENFKASSAILYNDDYQGNQDKQQFDIKTVWEGLYEYIPNELLDSMSEPLVGNPYHVLCDGRVITLDLACSVREYWLLSQHVDFKEIKSIAEVGGGYGRTAYVIAKLHPHIKYVLYDVEPSIGLAKRYLNEVLPVNNFEFNTPDELKGPCDLLLAINCLHEMKVEHVRDYFDYADKNASYFYFSCWYRGTVPFDNLVWLKSDYPVRPHWKLLLSQPHIRQGWFEEMYRCLPSA